MDTVCKTESRSQSCAYAAISADRENSASGGVFPVLAKAVLAQGGIVFGAAWGPDWNVHHIAIENTADLPALQSAKYAPSHLDGVYSQVKEQLDQGRQVLFSGTPCQVGGLRAYLKEDHPNLLCVDLFCHGTPMEQAWQAYRFWRTHQESDQPLAAVNMRRKSPGWSRYNYALAFTYADGTQTLSPSGQDLFMQGFIRDYYLKESCYRCAFKGDHHPGDITLGDFWGIWDLDPEFDDDRGTSAVVIHTEKGWAAWQQIMPQLRAKAFPLSDVVAQNPCYYRCVDRPAQRDLALPLLAQYSFDRVMAQLLPEQKKVRFRLVRRIIGKLRRMISERR